MHDRIYRVEALDFDIPAWTEYGPSRDRVRMDAARKAADAGYYDGDVGKALRRIRVTVVFKRKVRDA